MILVDSSVWVDHLRHTEPQLVDLLQQDRVLAHPWVIGELALGHLRQRAEILDALGSLPCAPLAAPDEVLFFIERHALQGSGIGLIDVHLLASVHLLSGTRLWTRDRRLRAVAERLSVVFAESAR